MIKVQQSAAIMNQFGLLCQQLRNDYGQEGVMRKECSQLAERLETSCCFFQGLSVLVREGNDHNEDSLLNADLFVDMLKTCHRRCCEKLLQTDLPLYRSILVEYQQRQSISSDELQRSVEVAILKEPHPLNPSFSRLMSSKLGPLNQVENIYCFLDDVEEACTSGRLALCRREFDQSINREQLSDVRIRSQEDFFDYLLSMELREDQRFMLVRKIQEFEEVLQSERLNPQNDSVVGQSLVHSIIISRKASLDTLALRRYEDDQKQLEMQLTLKREECVQLTRVIQELGEDLKRILEDNQLLREELCEIREQNKELRLRIHEFEIDSENQQLAFDEEKTQLTNDFKQLQHKYRELAENLHTCQQTSRQLQRLLSAQRSRIQFQSESRPAMSPVALQLQSKPLSKQTSYKGNLCEQMGSDNICEYYATPPPQRQTCDKTQWDTIPTANFKRTDSVMKDLQMLFSSHKKDTEQTRAQSNEIFVQPVVMLNEQEMHNTKMLCLNRHAVQLYSQDTLLVVEIGLQELMEVVLPSCNPHWLVIRTTSCDYLLEMQRRYELAAILQFHCPVTTAEDDIKLIYRGQQKRLQDLPRELYNPMRFIGVGSVMCGHLFFKENRRLSSQEFLPYYGVLTRSALLLFDSQLTTIMRVVPVLESSELTEISSPADPFKIWRLSNRHFTSNSYSLGFQTVRLAYSWTTSLLNCITVLSGQNSACLQSQRYQFPRCPN